MLLAELGLAFISGVWISTVLSVPTFAVVSISAVCAGSAWITRRRPTWVWWLIVSAFALGIARHAGTKSHPGIHDIAHYVGRTAQMVGNVSSEPDVRDTGVSYLVTVNHLIKGGVSEIVSGKVRVRVSRSVEWGYGDRLTLRARLYPAIALPPDVGGVMQFPRVLTRLPESSGWGQWITSIRRRLEDNINAWLPEPEAALLIAVAVGAHTAALGDLGKPLIASGLIHVIAISGIKVALVAGMLYQLSALTGRRLIALVFPVSGIVVYVALTGFTPAGLRSGSMWALVLIAGYLGRSTVALVSLAFAVAVMVAIDPSLLWDLGFQMSVCGTVSIVALATPLSNRFTRIPTPFRQALCVTIAAQVGTLPVVISGFHTVAVWGPLANMVVLPLLPALIILGFALGTVSGAPIVAAPVAAAAYFLLHSVTSVALAIGRLPGVANVLSVEPVQTALYYLLLIPVMAYALRRENFAPPGGSHDLDASVVVTFAALLGFGTAAALTPTHALGTTVKWLGSGNALLVQSVGNTMLIDGSSKPMALLERLGAALPINAHEIGAIVVTDPRASNVAALREVLRHYRVGEVLDVGVQYPSLLYAQWRHDIRDRAVPAFTLRAGTSITVGKVRAVALAPDTTCSLPVHCSGVIRLDLPGTFMVVATGAGSRQQHELVFSSDLRRVGEAVVYGADGYDVAFTQSLRAARVLSDAPVPSLPTSLLHLGAPRVLYSHS